jgi:hypothetical protein
MFEINTQSRRDIRTLRQGDPGFMLDDGFVSYPRAMLHILPECPVEYSLVIQKCVQQGWLKPVAHVQGKELTWQQLTR